MSDCGCDAVSQDLQSYDAALQQMLGACRPLTDSESLPLQQALGRVLASAVDSLINVPGWDNSAMDGYALHSRDLDRGADTGLPISQRIPAGQVGAPLQPETAARIFTGAPIPAGADTVVMQEHCQTDGDRLFLHTLPAAGANVRKAGEDIRAGSQIIPAGTCLQPQHLGLAASVGAANVRVLRRLKVAVLASGDELVMPGQPLADGQIYNSNLFTLSALLQALGCEQVHTDIVSDSLDATCEALRTAATRADLILASGGVSVGEEDHVKPAVERLGSLDLWKIAIRPGKPVAFGQVAGVPFIGAPGNPVSLFVTFVLFARPFIKKMQGLGDDLPSPMRVAAAFDWPRPDKRREFVRARLERDNTGEPRLHCFASRSSGVLSSVTWANGLAIIPENQVVRQGDPLQFLPFSELLR
jgi:molybdopterin molybdotransferase